MQGALQNAINNHIFTFREIGENQSRPLYVHWDILVRLLYHVPPSSVPPSHSSEFMLHPSR